LVLMVKMVLAVYRLQFDALKYKIDWMCGEHNSESLTLELLKAFPQEFIVVDNAGKKGDKAWVFLRGTVRYPISDKQSVIVALKGILGAPKLKVNQEGTSDASHSGNKPPSQPRWLLLKTLREKFQRETGVPFGDCGYGSLFGFLHKYPKHFVVETSKTAKHTKSRVRVV